MLGATTYVNDLDALPYLRIFPRGKFRIVVVPGLVKGGARDVYCINHGCRECWATEARAIVQSGGRVRPLRVAPASDIPRGDLKEGEAENITQQRAKYAPGNGLSPAPTSERRLARVPPTNSHAILSDRGRWKSYHERKH
jgi:hypothetical protein